MVLLGQAGLLKDMIRNLKYCDWCGALPFKWNDNVKKLELKSQRKLYIFITRLWIASLYIILSFIQVVRVFKTAPLVVITHSVMFLACGSLNLSCHLVNYKQRSGVVGLCNNLIGFEQKFSKDNAKTDTGNKRKSSTTDFFLRYMMYLLTCTGITMPIVYHLDILRNPCLPMYVGNWLSSQCLDEKPGYHFKATWTYMEIGTKVGISLLSYFNWSLLLVGCCFEQGLEYVLEGDCFRVYIAEFGR